MSEASEGLIGCVLLDPERVMAEAVTRGVTGEWFADIRGQVVWEAMEKLHRDRKSIDPLMLVGELKRKERLFEAGGQEQIEKYMDQVPTATHAEMYLDVMAREYMSRGIERTFAEMRDDIRDDPGMAIGQIVNRLTGLMEKGAGTLEVEKHPLLARKMEQWREVSRQRFEMHNSTFCMGVPLPWACMNSVFAGLRPGLHIVGARTSVGKTVYATNVSQFWCERGIEHAFVSLDMPASELLSRYVSQQSRVSLRKLEWGARHDELEKAEEQLPGIDRSNMHMTEISHIERLEGWLNMAVQRWKIQAVIVDYVQLVRMKGDRRMRAFERVCEVVQIMKAMANRMRIPFVLLAQLSREIDKAERENVYAEPRMSDLGDSSELEKAASSVMLLYRDGLVEEAWRQQPPIYLGYGDEHLARNLRALWLKIEKNQQGLAGVRRPFVMYPHQFILRPGCYECRQPIEFEYQDRFTGKTKKAMSWEPAFAKIRDDWRVLEEDQKLADAGGLGSREYRENE